MDLSVAIQAVAEVEETMKQYDCTDIPYATVIYFKDGSIHLYGELKKRIKENR